MRGCIFLGLVVWVACGTALPVQSPANNQGAPPQQWMWTGTPDIPKSMAMPFPNPPVSSGSEGNPQFGQQKSPMWQQGLGTDPWSSFQTNHPIGTSTPFDFGTQEPLEQGFNGMNTYPDNFPYTKPYANHFPQSQGPPPRPPMPDSMSAPDPMSFPNGSPPPRGIPPPPRGQHPFGHLQMFGQNRPLDWRMTGRSNTPEMPPPSSPFDPSGRYPIEFSPIKAPNGSMPAITVQYNVTYTFTPWGWKTLDVSVSNATFHPTASERVVEITGAPAGSLQQQPDMKSQDQFMPSANWWWPKQGFQPNPNPNPQPAEGNEPSGFGDSPANP